MSVPVPGRPLEPDALVIGAGLIGLCVADALAERGASVVLVSEPRPGDASTAGAGMLAPTVEPMDEPARSWALAARDRFPAYVEDLRRRTGVAVPLDRTGILEIALGEARAARLRAEASGDVRWLEPREIAEVEPALAPTRGGLLHPLDGAVDNVVLLEALRRSVARREQLRHIVGAVVALERSEERGEAGSGVVVRLADGRRFEAPVAVLAAGAWSAQLAGLPAPLPVTPGRGQMLAYGGVALRHVVYADDAYLVPRPDGRTLVGATMEDVGFDHGTTADAMSRLRGAAERIVPAVRDASPIAHWAGLRPMSPDGLPILGPDPEWPALLYACGHSRNGILMAPITGDAIAALALGVEPPFDLSAFSIERFRRRVRAADR